MLVRCAISGGKLHNAGSLCQRGRCKAAKHVVLQGIGKGHSSLVEDRLQDERIHKGHGPARGREIDERLITKLRDAGSPPGLHEARAIVLQRSSGEAAESGP